MSQPRLTLLWMLLGSYADTPDYLKKLILGLSRPHPGIFLRAREEARWAFDGKEAIVLQFERSAIWKPRHYLFDRSRAIPTELVNSLGNASGCEAPPADAAASCAKSAASGKTRTGALENILGAMDTLRRCKNRCDALTGFWEECLDRACDCGANASL